MTTSPLSVTAEQWSRIDTAYTCTNTRPSAVYHRSAENSKVFVCHRPTHITTLASDSVKDLLRVFPLDPKLLFQSSTRIIGSLVRVRGPHRLAPRTPPARPPNHPVSNRARARRFRMRVVSTKASIHRRAPGHGGTVAAHPPVFVVTGPHGVCPWRLAMGRIARTSRTLS